MFCMFQECRSIRSFYSHKKLGCWIWRYWERVWLVGCHARMWSMGIEDSLTQTVEILGITRKKKKVYSDISTIIRPCSLLLMEPVFPAEAGKSCPPISTFPFIYCTSNVVHCWCLAWNVVILPGVCMHKSAWTEGHCQPSPALVTWWSLCLSA